MSNTRTAHSSELLRGKLAAVRNKQLYVALSTGVAWLVLAAAVVSHFIVKKTRINSVLL